MMRFDGLETMVRPVTASGAGGVCTIRVRSMIGDEPARAHDALDREVEPGAAAHHFEFLAIWQPVSPVHQQVLQHQRQSLDPRVENRGAREGDGQPHQVAGRAVEVHAADHSRSIRIARPEQQLVCFDPPARHRNRQRVGNGELVARPPRRRERMRQVTHIIAVTQPDAITEIVGDHAVAIVVEADISRQQHRVAAPDDALLGDARRLPADQRRQLHQLHHPWRQHGGVAQVHQELQRPRTLRRSTRGASSPRGPAEPRRDPPWRWRPGCPRPGPAPVGSTAARGAPSARAPASGEIRIAG